MFILDVFVNLKALETNRETSFTTVYLYKSSYKIFIDIHFQYLLSFICINILLAHHRKVIREKQTIFTSAEMNMTSKEETSVFFQFFSKLFSCSANKVFGYFFNFSMICERNERKFKNHQFGN